MEYYPFTMKISQVLKSKKKRPENENENTNCLIL